MKPSCFRTYTDASPIIDRTLCSGSASAGFERSSNAPIALDREPCGPTGGTFMAALPAVESQTTPNNTLSKHIIKEENSRFSDGHQHVHRRSLAAHRVRDAFLATRDFVMSHRAHAIPDFDVRLPIYSDLLLAEMVRCNGVFMFRLLNVSDSRSTSQCGGQRR